MTGSPSSSAKQALGVRLRDLRKLAGLNARQLATATGQHYTRVSKIENGVQAPTDADIRRWCQACGADGQAPDLIATLRSVESADTEFRRQSLVGTKHIAGCHGLKRYEQTRVFRIYEHNVIPGLFQTVEYATAMLSFWIKFLDAPNDVEEAVAIRMRRQKVLHQTGRRFVTLLEEQALRTWFGTAETQAGQLGRLLELMSMQNISIGIIPLMTQRLAVASAGFWIFDDALVTLETPTASIEIAQPGELDLYIRMFEVLKATALYGKEARSLIIKTLAELNQPAHRAALPMGRCGAKGALEDP